MRFILCVAATLAATCAVVRADEAHDLTRKLHDLAAHHAKDAELLATAEKREKLLAALAHRSIAEVVKLAFTAKDRAALPANVQAHVEERTAIDGTLLALPDHPTRTRYVLATDQGRLGLLLVKPLANVKPGKVTVSGIKLAHLFLVESETDFVQATPGVPLPNTIGAQNVLVLLVNFQDDTRQPYTVEQARSLVFDAGSNFMRECSYGQTWLTGDVRGWITLPMKAADAADTTLLANDAQAAVTSSGINLASYRSQVYVFPTQNALNWGGLGTVGGSPGEVWINGDIEWAFEHELGHNLGLQHAHSWSKGTPIRVEYGDGFDRMGFSYGEYDAFHKEQLGWLGTSATPPIQLVVKSGIYQIGPMETRGEATPRALKIWKTDATGARTWYYVECRRSIGADARYSPPGNVFQGVLVHTGTEGDADSSYLIDVARGSQFSTGDATKSATGNAQAIVDTTAALVKGKTYADAAANGLSITVVSVGNEGAVVKIGLDAGPPPPPATTTAGVRGGTAGDKAPREGAFDPWVRAIASKAYLRLTGAPLPEDADLVKTFRATGKLETGEPPKSAIVLYADGGLAVSNGDGTVIRHESGRMELRAAVGSPAGWVAGK